MKAIAKLELTNVVHSASYKEKCRGKYPGLFADTGKHRNTQIKVHVDQTVKTVCKSPDAFPPRNEGGN